MIVFRFGVRKESINYYKEKLEQVPSGRDGGACNTSMGLSCFDIFMVTLDQKYIKWDLIQFNFGLHDLDNSSNAEQSYRYHIVCHLYILVLISYIFI